ncbi:unnamed protein product [Gordionus sp. m RMFG-2023]
MGTNTQKTSLAESLSDLNSYVNIEENLKGKSVTLILNSAAKIFNQAKDFNSKGELELAYISFMKFFQCIKVVQDSKEYRKEKVFYDQLLGHQQIESIKKAEELSEYLKRDYEKQRKEKLSNIKKLSNIVLDFKDANYSDKNDPISPKIALTNKEPQYYLTVDNNHTLNTSDETLLSENDNNCNINEFTNTQRMTINCKTQLEVIELHKLFDLYALCPQDPVALFYKHKILNVKDYNLNDTLADYLLIIDVRSFKDYNISRVLHPFSINIPPEILNQSFSSGDVNDWYQRIYSNRNEAKFWDALSCFDNIIILDEFGNEKETQYGSVANLSQKLDPIKRIVDILWPIKKAYQNLYYLKGGFKAWSRQYPMLTTHVPSIADAKDMKMTNNIESSQSSECSSKIFPANLRKEGLFHKNKDNCGLPKSNILPPKKRLPQSFDKNLDKNNMLAKKEDKKLYPDTDELLEFASQKQYVKANRKRSSPRTNTRSNTDHPKMSIQTISEMPHNSFKDGYMQKLKTSQIDVIDSNPKTTMSVKDIRDQDFLSKHGVESSFTSIHPESLAIPLSANKNLTNFPNIPPLNDIHINEASSYQMPYNVPIQSAPYLLNNDAKISQYTYHASPYVNSQAVPYKYDPYLTNINYFSPNYNTDVLDRRRDNNLNSSNYAQPEIPISNPHYNTFGNENNSINSQFNTAYHINYQNHNPNYTRFSYPTNNSPFCRTRSNPDLLNTCHSIVLPNSLLGTDDFDCGSRPQQISNLDAGIKYFNKLKISLGHDQNECIKDDNHPVKHTKNGHSLFSPDYQPKYKAVNIQDYSSSSTLSNFPKIDRSLKPYKPSNSSLKLSTNTLVGGNRYYDSVNDQHKDPENVNTGYLINRASSSEEDSPLKYKNYPPLEADNEATESDRHKDHAAEEINSRSYSYENLDTPTYSSRVPNLTNISSHSLASAQQNNYSHSIPNYGLTGILNTGNSCFINSILQGLSHTTPLAEYFVNKRYLKHLNYNKKNKKFNQSQQRSLAAEFAGVVGALWRAEYLSINPISFSNTMSQYAPLIEIGTQQDSHELLTFLIDGLHEDLNIANTSVLTDTQNQNNESQTNMNIPDSLASSKAWKAYRKSNDSIIVDLMSGQLKSVVQCQKCSKESITFDTFQGLSLPLPANGRCTVQDCLRLFLSPEPISDWRCPNCNKRTRACKKLFLWSIPPILIIHLMRFKNEGQTHKKITTCVDFPLNGFDLSNYCSSSREDLNADYKTLSEYSLYAISNHYGTLDGGHYTAFCKNPFDLKWYKYDDQQVTQIDNADVRTSAAYILFYTSLGTHIPDFLTQ